MDKSAIRDEVVQALMKVYDPEIPVNIYDIGLIYEVEVKDDGEVDLTMTLTSPNCPVAETLPIEARDAAASIDGVTKADVRIVWDPPWNPSMMSEAAQLELGMY